MAIPTLRLNLQKPEEIADRFGWGDLLNDNFDVIDRAVAGVEALDVAGSGNLDVTDPDATTGVLKLTGALTGNRVLRMPREQRKWLVHNGTTGEHTLTIGVAPVTGTGLAGDSVTIETGQWAFLYGDATNVAVIQFPTVIEAGTIDEAKLADDAVSSRVIAADVILSEHIAAAQIGTTELADEAVTTAKIDAGAVVEGKLGTGAVTEDKIGTGAVTEGKLGAGSVLESKIGTGAVTAGKLGSDAVTTVKIDDGAVTTAKLDTGAVTTGKIDDGAVTAAKLASGAVPAPPGAASESAAGLVELATRDEAEAGTDTARVITAAQAAHLWRQATSVTRQFYTRSSDEPGAPVLTGSLSTTGTPAIVSNTTFPAAGGGTWYNSITLATGSDLLWAVHVTTFSRPDGTFAVWSGPPSEYAEELTAQDIINQIDGVLGTSWKTGGGGTTVAAPNASQTTPGIIEIATPPEVRAGTDNARAVTPASLAHAIQSLDICVVPYFQRGSTAPDKPAPILTGTEEFTASRSGWVKDAASVTGSGQLWSSDAIRLSISDSLYTFDWCDPYPVAETDATRDTGFPTAVQIGDLLGGSGEIDESALSVDLINAIRAGSNHHLEATPITLQNPNSGNARIVAPNSTYYSSVGSTEWESISVRFRYSEITGDGQIHGLTNNQSRFLLPGQSETFQVPYIRNDGELRAATGSVEYQNANDRLRVHLAHAENPRANSGPSLEVNGLYGYEEVSGAAPGLDQAAVDARVEAVLEALSTFNLQVDGSTDRLIIHDSSTGNLWRILPRQLPAATGSVAGLMSAADKTKLDGIETGAQRDLTSSQIKTAYEANPNTNAFTDADHAKLDGIEAGATAGGASAATTGAAGIVELATQDEVDAGTDAVRAIVPSTLVEKLRATEPCVRPFYLTADSQPEQPASVVRDSEAWPQMEGMSDPSTGGAVLWSQTRPLDNVSALWEVLYTRIRLSDTSWLFSSCAPYRADLSSGSGTSVPGPTGPAGADGDDGIGLEYRYIRSPESVVFDGADSPPPTLNYATQAAFVKDGNAYVWGLTFPVLNEANPVVWRVQRPVPGAPASGADVGSIQWSTPVVVARRGADGADGAAGAAGERGPEGPQGPAGQDGADGSSAPAASTTTPGLIEIADAAEGGVGTSTNRAMTPALVASALANTEGCVLAYFARAATKPATPSARLQTTAAFTETRGVFDINPATATGTDQLWQSLCFRIKTRDENYLFRWCEPFPVGNTDATAGGSGGGATTLDGLTDVDTSTTAPTDGQSLVWDADAGEWVPGAAQLTTPTFDIYIVGYSSDRIYRWNGTAWDSGFAVPTGEGVPIGISVDPANGDIVLIGNQTDRIYRWDGTAWDGGFAIPATATNPNGVAVDPNSGDILLVDSDSDLLYRWDGSAWDAGVALPTAEPAPRGITVDRTTGDVFMVGATSPLAVHRWDGSAWDVALTLPSQFARPEGIAVDPANGDLLIVDRSPDRLFRSSDGVWDNGVAIPGGEGLGAGVAIDFDGTVPILPLNTDGLKQGQRNLYFSAGERTKLAGIEAGATAGGGGGSASPASMTTPGILRLATAQESVELTEANAAITPLGLGFTLNDLNGQTTVVFRRSLGGPPSLPANRTSTSPNFPGDDGTIEWTDTLSSNVAGGTPYIALCTQLKTRNNRYEFRYTGPFLIADPYSTANVPAASITQRGTVELATGDETEIGSDQERATTPSGISNILNHLDGNSQAYFTRLATKPTALAAHQENAGSITNNDVPFDATRTGSDGTTWYSDPGLVPGSSATLWCQIGSRAQVRRAVWNFRYGNVFKVADPNSELFTRSLDQQSVGRFRETPIGGALTLTEATGFVGQEYIFVQDPLEFDGVELVLEPKDSPTDREAETAIVWRSRLASATVHGENSIRTDTDIRLLAGNRTFTFGRTDATGSLNVVIARTSNPLEWWIGTEAGNSARGGYNIKAANGITIGGETPVEARLIGRADYEPTVTDQLTATVSDVPINISNVTGFIGLQAENHQIAWFPAERILSLNAQSAGYNVTSLDVNSDTRNNVVGFETINQRYYIGRTADNTLLLSVDRDIDSNDFTGDAAPLRVWQQIGAAESGSVRFDVGQTLSATQQTRARDNIGVAAASSDQLRSGPVPIGPRQLFSHTSPLGTASFGGIWSMPVNVGENNRLANYVEAVITSVTTSDGSALDVDTNVQFYYRIGDTSYPKVLAEDGRITFSSAEFDGNSLRFLVRRIGPTQITRVDVEAQAYRSDMAGESVWALGPRLSYALTGGLYYYFAGGRHYHMEDIDRITFEYISGQGSSFDINDPAGFPVHTVSAALNSASGGAERTGDIQIYGWSGDAPVARVFQGGGQYDASTVPGNTGRSNFRLVRSDTSQAGTFGGIYVASHSGGSGRILRGIKLYPRAGRVL